MNNKFTVVRLIMQKENRFVSEIEKDVGIM